MKTKRLFLGMMACVLFACNTGKTKKDYYKYAKDSLQYDEVKAKQYAKIHIKIYEKAKEILDYGNTESEYFTYAVADLGYGSKDIFMVEKGSPFFGAVTPEVISEQTQKAQYYVYARETLNYEDKKAQYYAYAKKDLKYKKDEKAKAYAENYLYAKEILKYTDKKSKYYVYARGTLNYKDKKAQFYAYARAELKEPYNVYTFNIFSDNYYDDKRAQAYAYARADLKYDDKKAQKYANSKAKN